MTEIDMYQRDDGDSSEQSTEWNREHVMFHLGIVELIVAEREREIEANMQRRRQLRVEDAATEPSFPARRAPSSRPMAVRARSTGS